MTYIVPEPMEHCATKEEVLHALEKASDRNIIVTIHLAMIKAGQMSFFDGMVSMVNSLTNQTEILEDRVSLLLAEAQEV